VRENFLKQKSWLSGGSSKKSVSKSRLHVLQSAIVASAADNLGLIVICVDERVF
jgi:hypothetical protein